MMAHKLLIAVTRTAPISIVSSSKISSRGIKYWGEKNHLQKSYVENPEQSQDITRINETVFLEDYLDVKVTHNDEVTYIDAVPISTGREGKIVEIKTDHSETEPCALCRLDLTNLHYTDVMILSQFIKKDGSLATYHESKLCSKQYIRVKKMIRDAQRCNLIPRPPDYLVPGPWHNLNTYLEIDRKRDQPKAIIKKEYWRTGSN